MSIEPSTVDPHYWDSLDDSDERRADELRQVLKVSPTFVGDALGSVDNMPLLGAYILGGDIRKAVDNMVEEHIAWWYAREEKHLRGPWYHKPNEREVLESIACPRQVPARGWAPQ